MYKNLMAYLAIGMELTVDRDTGEVHIHRAVAAIDTGQIGQPGRRAQPGGGRHHPVRQLDALRTAAFR